MSEIDKNTLSKQVEAILFFKGEPVSLSKLAQFCDSTEEKVIEAIEHLKLRLENGGLTLIEHNGSYLLGTGTDSSPIIEKIIKDELHRDLGRAGIETLSIIMYLGPISRSELDSIRGVNSSFIIRNLLIRGLVERIENPNNKRSFQYQVTFDLLSHLGLKSIKELPDYESLREELLIKQKSREEAEKKSLEAE